MTKPDNQHIQQLLFFRDIPGLVAELRCYQDPDHRQQAARALGSLQDPASISWLVQSALYDPDPGVKRAVREILYDRLGRDLDLALQVEASGGLPEEPWLMDPHLESSEDWDDDEDWDDSLEEDELEEGEEDDESEENLPLDELEHTHLTSVQQDEIRGLIMIAAGESNPVLRLRAVQALAKFAHLDGFRTLAEISIAEEDESVRRAAREALEKRFGEHLPAMLEGFGLGEADEEYEEDEEEDEEEDDASLEKRPLLSLPVSTTQTSQPPVVQEEKLPGVVWFVLLLGGMLILGLWWAGILQF